MKIIALGDIHGRFNWKEIVSKNNDANKIIFIGDYLDTHDNISGNQQLENFKDIIEFKKSNLDRVILLFGNHDFHYLSTSKFQYSGFQPTFKFSFQEQLHKAIDENLLQMCFKYNSFLFTHAGISKTWCKNNNINLDNIEESINDLFKFKPNSFEFTPGERMDNYGDDITQTPIWIRPDSLLENCLDNYIQIVGHTTQKQITNADNKIMLIDTLGQSGEYLQILNNVISAQK